MSIWMSQYWEDINIILAIWTFVISIFILAFSSIRFIFLRIEEKKKERFKTYHDLLSAISRGSDEKGTMKLVSQRAYIYELRHFKEYAPLTLRLLESLQEEWKKGDQGKMPKLILEIEETKKSLARRWYQLR